MGLLYRKKGGLAFDGLSRMDAQYIMAAPCSRHPQALFRGEADCLFWSVL